MLILQGLRSGRKATRGGVGPRWWYSEDPKWRVFGIFSRQMMAQHQPELTRQYETWPRMNGEHAKSFETLFLVISRASKTREPI